MGAIQVDQVWLDNLADRPATVISIIEPARVAGPMSGPADHRRPLPRRARAERGHELDADIAAATRRLREVLNGGAG